MTEERTLTEAAVIARTFRVGKRTCTITIPTPCAGAIRYTTVEWSPTVPTKLNKKELRQYRANRDAALADVAKILGGTGLVIEI